MCLLLNYLYHRTSNDLYTCIAGYNTWKRCVNSVENLLKRWTLLAINPKQHESRSFQVWASATELSARFISKGLQYKTESSCGIPGITNTFYGFHYLPTHTHKTLQNSTETRLAIIGMHAYISRLFYHTY